jgi:hypothetical protein
MRTYEAGNASLKWLFKKIDYPALSFLARSRFDQRENGF